MRVSEKPIMKILACISTIIIVSSLIAAGASACDAHTRSTGNSTTSIANCNQEKCGCDSCDCESTSDCSQLNCDCKSCDCASTPDYSQSVCAKTASCAQASQSSCAKVSDSDDDKDVCDSECTGTIDCISTPDCSQSVCEKTANCAQASCDSCDCKKCDCKNACTTKMTDPLTKMNL